jgi:hypothetical protein
LVAHAPGNKHPVLPTRHQQDDMGTGSSGSFM